MSSQPAKRPDVLARWSRVIIPAHFAAADAARRGRIVSAISEVLQRAGAERRKRRQIRWILAPIAAATFVLFLLAARVVPHRVSSLVLGRAHEPIARPRAAASASEAPAQPMAVAPHSPAPPSTSHASVTTALEDPSRLRLASGVDVTMGPGARLSPATNEGQLDTREVLLLELGWIHVEVPKLPRGHTFEVRTPDAWVVVHGTSFSVEVTRANPSAPPATQVVVSSGIVSVRHAKAEVLLSAGMEWSSPTEGSSFAKSNPIGVSSRAARPKRELGGMPPASALTAVPDPSAAAEPATLDTDLAEQNRLFAEAVVARERGDLESAVRTLDIFVRRYPSSPLAQDAYVERFRALARMGEPVAATRAARGYLTLYPNGFAREEARALALKPEANVPPKSVPHR